MKSKECRICKEDKPLGDYYLRKDSGRYSNNCKKCAIIRNSKYSSNNCENNKIYSKEYYKNNKETVLKRHKRYQENNKDKIKEYSISYTKDNKEKIKDNSKNHYISNKEKILKNGKLYYENNKDKVKKRHKEYEKKAETKKKRRKRNEKKRENPIFRLCHSVSAGISQSLKLNNLSKGGRHWEDLVGYTFEDLKTHMENLFSEGMTWDNYGKWHLDHVTPKSLFKIKEVGDEEFMKCWALSNLQPLWAVDNLSKGNTLNWEKK